MPIPGLLEEHAEEAAFLWLLRHQAALAPDYNRRELAELEGRLLAHLEGLALASDAAWQTGKTMFEEQTEIGEAFIATNLALQSGERARFDDVVELAGDDESATRGLRGAVAWSPLRRVEPLLTELAASAEPRLRTIGLAGFGAHRRTPPRALNDDLHALDPALVAQAARTAAQLGLVNHLGLIRERRDAANPSDAALLYWCTWSSILLGDRQDLGPLLESAHRLDGYAGSACELLGRALDPARATAWHRELRSEPTATVDLALRAAATMGQTDQIDWILEQMHDPTRAQQAGDALHRITGVDLAEANLTAEPREHDDSEDWRPEDDLPWPDPEACAAWWQKSPLAEGADRAMLLGHPKSDRAALATLLDCDTTSQRNRHDAAIERALSQPGEPLREVRVRAG